MIFTVQEFSLNHAITFWFDGNEFQKADLIAGVKVIWIQRTGLIFEFIASMTIIAEIIGKQRAEEG